MSRTLFVRCVKSMVQPEFAFCDCFSRLFPCAIDFVLCPKALSVLVLFAVVNEVYVDETIRQAPSTLFYTCNMDVIVLEVLKGDVGWGIVSHVAFRC